MTRIDITEANRTKVARAINFNQYPVIKLDIADRDEYGLKGGKVRIDNGTFSSGDKYYVHATLRVWSDERKLDFSARNTCLHKDFGYHDVEEMLEWAAAPIVKPGQEIAVVVIDSRLRNAYAVYIVKLGEQVSPHCMTPIRCEEVDFTPYFYDIKEQ